MVGSWILALQICLPPPRLRWYGLVPVGLPTRGLEIYPSPVSLVPLPGTTRTTVCGIVSSLDEYSSDEEDYYPLLATLGVMVPPSCFVASRGLLPPLYTLSVRCLSYSPDIPFTSAWVGLKGVWVASSANLFARLAPPRVLIVARDFPRLSV